MKALKSKAADVEFIGIGGKAMSAEGLQSIAQLKDIAVVGFWEVARKYAFFRKLLNECKTLLSDKSVKAFIPIDYPGFNIRLAGFAKSIGLPVFYYIAPQLWAWGKNRARKLSGCADKLLCVFPFEANYFSKFGIDAEFVGHPLLDDPTFDFDQTKNKRGKLIAMLAGSRPQEVSKHLPLLIETSEIIGDTFPEYSYAVAASESVGEDYYRSALGANAKWEIWSDSRELMKASSAGLVKTGTSTLEAALLDLPFAMYYKTSPITYFLGKRLINLPHICLVNILLGRTAANEFIQRDATPAKLAAEVIEIINNGNKRASLLESFSETRSLLGKSGASDKASEIILRNL